MSWTCVLFQPVSTGRVMRTSFQFRHDRCKANQRFRLSELNENIVLSTPTCPNVATKLRATIKAAFFVVDRRESLDAFGW